MIGDAKRKAADANSTAGNTMNRLNDIQKEIDQIKVTPANSNLSNVLNDVDKTGKTLHQFFSQSLFYCSFVLSSFNLGCLPSLSLSSSQ